MIEWHEAKDGSLPTEKGQKCLLYSVEAGYCLGPISWEGMAWLDLFGPQATEEAGTIITPGGEGGPTHWAVWNGPNDK